MRRKKHQGRLALALLFSGLVFLTNTLAMLLTFLVMHILSQLGVIEMAGDPVELLNILKFVFWSSLMLGLLLTSTAGRLPLRPINRLTEQLNRLAGGDFKARLHFGKPLGEHPTFKQIETSFNRAAEELEHTELLRSDFINNFSHEFKTPIVSIAGFAKLLRRGNLTPSQQAEYLEVIEEESLRLAALANNVLNLTQVENQMILTDVTTFNLSEQIRGAVLLLAEKWMPKDIVMELSFGEYSIAANEELLKQVWINLLDNAIKFSAPGGTVSVSISASGDELAVAVVNHGRDIPADALPRIFNRFYQADESHSSEGNGIGLAVVKKVCLLHGGDVSVTSADGTTAFTVCLPKQQN